MMRSPIRARTAAIGRDVARNTRGVALIELAICLPFLVLLFVGGFQLSDGMSARRKVTAAARTIADLTSQYTTVTDSDLTTILNASQQVLAPYSQANAKMTVSQIKIDASSKATVDWSKGKNIDGLTKGADFNVPAEIKQANTAIIVAQIVYSYQPTALGKLFGTIPLTETIIMSPRASASIVHP